MQLQMIMLAKDADYVDGCLDIRRGGWDTIGVNSEQPRLSAVLLIKLLLVGREVGAEHRLELTCRADGSDAPFLSADKAVAAVRPEGYPPYWPVPVDVVIRLDGPLPTVGAFVITVSVAGQQLGDLNFRAVPQTVASVPAQTH